MWNWDDGHMDDGWGLAMMLSMLGIWVLLTAAIVFAVLWAVRSTRTPSAPPLGSTAAPAAGAGSVTASAERILAERLARGEIDAEEYRTRLDALTSRSGS